MLEIPDFRGPVQRGGVLVRTVLGGFGGLVAGAGLIGATWFASAWSASDPYLLASHLNPFVLGADLALLPLGLLGAVVGRLSAPRLVEPPPPPPDRSDEVEALTAQLHEITDDLANAHHDNERAQRALSSLYGNLSHELFTPLNAVIGYGELVLEDLTNDELATTRADVTCIIESAQRLHGMLQTFADLSRLETSRDQAFLEWFDVSATLDEAIEAVRPLAWENGVSLQVDKQIKKVHVRLDRARVLSILQTLLRQACEMAPNTWAKVTVRAEPMTQSLAFEVSDGGPPVPEDLYELAFDVFPDVPTSVRRLQGRRSAELALADRNTRLLGGGLHLVEPAEDAGCTFLFRVPIDASRHLLDFDADDGTDEASLLLDDEEDQDAIAPPRSPERRKHRAPEPTLIPAEIVYTRTAKPRRRGFFERHLSVPPETTEVHPPTGAQRGRLVLVQADEAARELQASKLAAEGWTVFPCSDAAEAVHLALLHRPDGFVVDWLDSAPDLWDLRRLARNRGLEGIPLVVQASSDDESVVFPVVDLVGGPVERGDLKACLDRQHPEMCGRLLLLEDPDHPSSIRSLAERAGWQVTLESELEPDALGNHVDLILVDLFADDFEALGTALERITQPTWTDVPLALIVPRQLPPGAPARLRHWLHSDLRARPEAPLSLAEAVEGAVRPRA